MSTSSEIIVRVSNREVLADGIVGLTLKPINDASLPEWSAGAHLNLKLPVPDKHGDELIRQYSLCGDPSDRSCYKIGVLREENGRGGSAYVNDSLPVGSDIGINPPRNHFPFEPSEKTLFIAGGIGITPLMPMLRQAVAENLDWHFVAAVRDQSRLAFKSVLSDLDPARITYHFDAEAGLLDLDALLGPLDAKTTVYSCGPTGLLDSLEERSKSASWKLKIERFSSSTPTDTDGAAFDIIIRSTGERLHVPADNTILEVVRSAGYKVESACTEGICGACETAILRGIPDHRDDVLTEDEQANNDCMMICVSRAVSSEIELDI